jgi:hypothetical protein
MLNMLQALFLSMSFRSTFLETRMFLLGKIYSKFIKLKNEFKTLNINRKNNMIHNMTKNIAIVS